MGTALGWGPGVALALALPRRSRGAWAALATALLVACWWALVSQALIYRQWHGCGLSWLAQPLRAARALLV